MAERDRAAVHVELLVRDADAIAAVEHLHGERLVQLPEIDVLHLLAGLLEELGHGEHRADTNLLRVAAGDGEAAKYSKGSKVPARSLLGRHHHARRGPIGELAGV